MLGIVFVLRELHARGEVQIRNRQKSWWFYFSMRSRALKFGACDLKLSVCIGLGSCLFPLGVDCRILALKSNRASPSESNALGLTDPNKTETFSGHCIKYDFFIFVHFFAQSHLNGQVEYDFDARSSVLGV
jgi:hypothetical protein